VFNLY